MKRFLFILAALPFVLVSSCSGSGKALLPNVSGKAGEVLVVLDKGLWDTATGDSVRAVLAAECDFLPFKAEPLYTLVNVTPSGFGDLFKVHRNIVIFRVGAGSDSTSLVFRRDVWARPQCVVQLSAPDAEAAVSLFMESGEKIVSAIEQAERDRVIANSIQYEQKDIAPVIRERFGAAPHIPVGYVLKKVKDDFIWIADEKKHSIQGIFIYKYPVAATDSAFTVNEMVSHRNAVLKENVPGMFENTYMTTSPQFVPKVGFISFRGRNFAQMRGMWEVENDFMGGPFASHSFYSEDGKEIIVAEAWVYAPKFDKRQYLRQTESIIWSWE